MVDVLVINALLDSLLKSLSIMAGIEPVPGVAIVKDNNVSLGEVTGLMEMSNDELKGSMSLSFSKSFVIDLVQKTLGDEIDEINDTAIDLTGEMTNMIAGGAKRILSEKELDIGMSTPSMLTGLKHLVEHPYDGQTIVLPFKADKGEIFLEINFVN